MDAVGEGAVTFTSSEEKTSPSIESVRPGCGCSWRCGEELADPGCCGGREEGEEAEEGEEELYKRDGEPCISERGAQKIQEK